ncbi:MAG: DEAD/DEAH box helicase [Methylococcales bacterium]|nr:DEAD/DEAH box helicase [Methylococcales bacterium]
MNITIKNTIKITDYSPKEHQAIVHKFTFANPAHAEALRFGRSVYNIDRTICLVDEGNDTLALPIGALAWLLETFSPDVTDNRTTVAASISFNGDLRLYQERFIKLSMQHTHGVMVAATGSGKTISAIAMAGRLQQRALVLVKSKDLAQQWRDAIKQFTGLDAGLIGGGKNTEGEQFTIGLIQSLCKRDLVELNYGLVIADECHNVPAQQAYSVINGINARYKFGLSATPQRRDNLEFMIHAALGDVVSEIEARELEGKVLPAHITSVKMPFYGTPETWAEFLTALVNDDSRNQYIIGKAIKSAQKMGTIILCAQVGHCEMLGVMAQERGVNALVLHGQLPSKERASRMARAHESPLIIGTLSLLSEGIDLPHLSSLIFASPVSAEPNRESPAATRLMQSIGRCRRPYPNKIRAYILDICDQTPFGYSASKKRMAIYQQQGFAVAP